MTDYNGQQTNFDHKSSRACGSGELKHIYSKIWITCKEIQNKRPIGHKVHLSRTYGQ